MSNELLFLGHIVVVIAFLLVALRLGKEALFAFISIMVVFANLFLLKQIDFFSFTITAADVFAIGAMLGLNLLQEYHGKKAATKAITISFVSLLLFMSMATIHLLYRPSSFDTAHSAYATLLRPAPRIVLASLIVFYITQKIDVAFFALLQKAFSKRWLSLRILISLFVTQGIDTFLFSFAALYGLVANIFDIIVMSFLIKLLVVLLSTPLTLFIRRRLVPV